MRTRTVLTALLTGALLPAGGPAAVAACAPPNARERAELASVIFTGVVETGPLTPARLRVEAWEKGRGPEVVEVDTGRYEDYVLDDGIVPQPGERWRIYGEFHEGRVLTGACEGSHRLERPAVPPVAALGPARVTLVPARYSGAALGVPLPVLRARTGATTLTLAPAVAYARLVGAPRGARLTLRRKRWTLRLPAHARARGRIVADTGDGFFAARLAPRRP